MSPAKRGGIADIPNMHCGIFIDQSQVIGKEVSVRCKELMDAVTELLFPAHPPRVPMVPLGSAIPGDESTQEKGLLTCGREHSLWVIAS